MSNENLNRFFDKIKTITLWDRLFFWSSIKSLSYDAYDEFKRIDNEIESLNFKISELNVDVKNKENINNVNIKEIAKLEREITLLREKKDELFKQNTGYEKLEEQKAKDYEHKVTEMLSLKKQLDDDRLRIENERIEEQEEKFKKMKETWQKHEDFVEANIKSICNKYTIEYLSKENVPFSGKPDNTLKIADEYIIFDAKSPQGDNLENFPVYINTQIDSVKKYIKQTDVKKDIFLVVPTNTIDKLETTYYNVGDYRVFIITTDSLEPIILCLKKIEDYEFAEKLSPEDRDRICTIIGRFAHTTKRRLQIDNFFAEECIALLNNCENLPEDIKDSAVKYEMGSKLNPPTEKRTKQIELKALTSKAQKTKKELEIQNVNSNVKSEQIEQIELYDKK